MGLTALRCSEELRSAVRSAAAVQVDGKILSDSFDDLHTKFLLLGQNAKKIIVTVRTIPTDLPCVSAAHCPVAL